MDRTEEKEIESLMMEASFIEARQRFARLPVNEYDAILRDHYGDEVMIVEIALYGRSVCL